MPPKVIPGPIQDEACIREAVCVHTKKIFDSCKDKDCIEDLRLFPTTQSLPIIENAVSIRAKSAKLLYVSLDVEDVSFNRGFYTIDVRYFYRIKADAYTQMNPSAEITGLAVFDKRVILFGSEGNAKVFSSNTVLGGVDRRTISTSNLPTAVVEAVDPIILNIKLVDVCNQPINNCECDTVNVPSFIADSFDSNLALEPVGRRILVTLGQFSIIRLERDSQLLIPAYDYCMPDKECEGSNDDDPCTLFSRIDFPVDEFFPPDTISQPEDYQEAIANLQ